MAPTPLFIRPSTPDNTPRRQAMNRSVTVPSRLATIPFNVPTAEVGAAEGVETLFVHPNANVVKFSTSSRGWRPSSAGFPRGADQDAARVLLPWTSPGERMMSAGPLEVYRIPGHLSFLHFGDLVHTILPRGNCWCVDGVSKFALRVAPETYYRIEMPAETPEDLAKVEELKETLKKVLYYERTPCPFMRTFSVALPEEPQARKGRRRSHGPAKKWRLDRADRWKPEDGGEPPIEDDDRSSEDGSLSDEDDPLPREEVNSGSPRQTALDLAHVANLNANAPSRLRGLASMRSITAPPQLSFASTPPSKMRPIAAVDRNKAPEAPSEDQQHQEDAHETRILQSIPTDMPPSPPDSSAGLDFVESWVHRQGSVEPEIPSETEQLAGAEQGEDAEYNASDTETPIPAPAPVAQTSPPIDCLALPARQPSIKRSPSPHVVLEQIATAERSQTPPTSTTALEDPFVAIQARILARRSLSGTAAFYPSNNASPTSSSSASSVTLTSRRPTSANSMHARSDFAAALVRKACSVFLGPPAHLVALMLRIAARFANGTFGTSFGADFMFHSPAGSKYVPGSFNVGSIDVEDDSEEASLEEWEEDDYGVPIRSPVRLANLHRSASGLSEREGWRGELD